MSQPQVWYKQFWPWFLIILPLCAVVASLYTLFISIEHKDSLVSQDYYKAGKAINMDLDKIRQAKQLGLQFELTLQDKEITLVQHGGTPYLAALTVNFFHPTLADRDFSQVTTADGDKHYRISLAEPLSGSWEVRLESYDASWRIEKRLDIQSDQSYWLN